jgi:hypothetical protein
LIDGRRGSARHAGGIQLTGEIADPDARDAVLELEQGPS